MKTGRFSRLPRHEVDAVKRKAGSQKRFLIVRHPTYRRFFFSVISRWVKVNLQQFAPWFEVRELPVRVKNWSRYALHVPWL
jgi:hypothetical protein